MALAAWIRDKLHRERQSPHARLPYRELERQVKYLEHENYILRERVKALKTRLGVSDDPT